MLPVLGRRCRTAVAAAWRHGAKRVACSPGVRMIGVARRSAVTLTTVPVRDTKSPPPPPPPETTTTTTDGAADVDPTATADATKPMSFIDKAKAFGANMLLGAFTHVGHRFDRVLQDLRVESIDTSTGTVRCVLPVKPGVQNAYATLHGGAVATLVDVVGTMSLLAVNPKKAGVSVDMSISYVSAAKANEDVIIEGRVLRAGRRLGFTQVDLRRASDNALIATGTHTKAL